MPRSTIKKRAISTPTSQDSPPPDSSPCKKAKNDSAHCTSSPELSPPPMDQNSAPHVMIANSLTGGRVQDINHDSAQITTLTRDYISEPMITRLNRMLNYSSAVNHIYALRTLPLSNLNWGPVGYGSDNLNMYLCCNKTPVTVWIIGELRTLKTRDYKDYHFSNAARPSVGIIPFHAVDLQAANNCLSSFSTSQSSESVPPDIIWAGRWMCKFGTGTTADEIPLFEDCYDATTKWIGTEGSQDLKLDASGISPRDVVLVEAGIKKRYLSERLEGQGGSKTNFHKWSVEFELQCIALLHKAPKSAGFKKELVAFEV
ncbi:hypothetical protein BDY19DRAFT_994585 [Irpex rosettiformis]|uniref:Uncharacterized protein n=1 Tax=Irpex rosettiformis TaxID=378272 RepID=A0ACB8U021_9APHY|nr:hypothetical protein BDY19DRAFT_994585 [Irpex rosettiformis]